MKKPVVIYIAGYGRSGSSALSRALAQDETVLSAGELGRLPNFIRNDHPCACGKPVSECFVWRNARTGTINDTMEAVIHANFPIVVDSSKTAYFDFHRPLLYRMNGYRVIMVHLKRPLSGVLNSISKGTNKDLEAGIKRRRALNRTRAVLGYSFAHGAAVANRLIFRDFIRVEHTDMTQDLSKVVHSILSLAENAATREPQDQILNRSTHGMHEIAGNRLLRDDGRV
ncbi:hypothetical protein SAMN05443432_11254 [Roseovarius litoreus]|uniref:Sulfotransferase family protein n=1 Tax=Roseovarius litoreus TaxID=1155722 RepID=A0A1M7KXJ9_9RHOB|nr:hypothetical protein [Roseovarius litoreus]SHM69984.1 hypothetical protein SAMN05443432_11254 [Roseovarius litoreus]